jgi:predicted Zn-dependent protease
MLGKAYMKQRKRDLAEKHFRALIENFPNRSEGFSLLGDLLLQQKNRSNEAKENFEAALKKDPLDIVALRGLLRMGPNPSLTASLQENLPF